MFDERIVLRGALLFVLGAALAVAPLAAAPNARAQSEAGAPATAPVWFPARPLFAPLLAAPWETGFRGSLVVSDRADGLYEGPGIEAEVSIGQRVPVVRLRRETARAPAVEIEFETGIFSRFYMETLSDLINTDFRVGAAAALRYRAWAGRAELRHISSHLGDDLAARFEDVPYRKVSYEGVEVLLARTFGAVRLYAGGAYNFHHTPNVGQTEALAGLEYDAGRASGRRFWPFAALALRAEDQTGHLAATGAAGLGFRLGSVDLRVEARAHAGPTPLGHFRTDDERFVGLGLRIER